MAAKPTSQQKKKATLKLPALHAGQLKAAAEAKQFNVLACGRRFGKTTFCEDRVIHPALNGFPIGWFSPSYKQLDPSWEHMKTILEPVTVSKNEQQKKLILISGGSVEFWSLDDPDSGRGRAYKAIVVDEAAIVKDLMDVWEKNLQWQLLDYSGMAWFLSTPRGIANDFKILFDRGGDAAYPDWASWRMPTFTNPHISAAFIEKLRRDTPELSFAQEVLAEFVSWEGAVFKRIMDALGRQLPLLNQTIIAVDWAGVGQRGDYNVFMAVDLGGTVLEIKRFRSESYSQQRSELRMFIERWSQHNLIKVVGEENNMGGPQIEKLREDGVEIESWMTGYANKQLVVEGLAMMFERDKIAIKAGIENHMVLIGELQAFGPKRTPTGLTTYAATSGHDDTVMALVIAAQYIAKENAGSMGWIEYLKGLQTKMNDGEVSLDKNGIVVPKNLIKPATGDATLKCPECSSICITNIFGTKRCGNCGKQWGGVQPEMHKQSRGEYMAALK